MEYPRGEVVAIYPRLHCADDDLAGVPVVLGKIDPS
jgi:hypothetical protein